jgi:nitrogen regulatory protein PII
MDNKYELVLCVVNAGFSQNVMEAARAAGAKGGTIVRARGTANPESEECFNITNQPDKEIVMILTKKEIKDDIMHAVYKECGPASEGQGLVFSLPVNRTTTLKEE